MHVYERATSIESALKNANPSLDSVRVLQEALTRASFAAAAGDMYELKRMVSSGFDLTLADYDDRTSLHIA